MANAHDNNDSSNDSGNPKQLYTYGSLPEREHANPLEPSDKYRLAPILGNNVAALLKLQEDLTKFKLHLMTGISRPMIDDIIAGVVDVRLSYLVNLAGAFGVNPLDLLVPHDWYQKDGKTLPMTKRLSLPAGSGSVDNDSSNIS